MEHYLRAVWRYRHFIVSSVRTDFQSRFARSRIAGVWIVAQPLIQVTIYAVILSSVLAGRFPGISSKYAYAVYLLAGSLAWTLFSEIVNRSLSVFIDFGNALKKIVFPRICLPVIVVCIALVNYLLILAAIFGVLLVIGEMRGMALLALLPLTLLTVLFAAGLGLILGTLNVFMRDFGPVSAVGIQLLYWFTPIVYPLEVVPEAFRWYVQLNPLTPLVQAYQRVLLYGEFPVWSSLTAPLVVAIACMCTGLLLFRRASPEMTDVL